MKVGFPLFEDSETVYQIQPGTQLYSTRLSNRKSESVYEQMANTSHSASMPIYLQTSNVHTLKKLLLFLNASFLDVTVYLVNKRISLTFMYTCTAQTSIESD